MAEISQFEAFCPVSLVQVHQHRLLKVRLAIINGNRVVVPIKSVNECLYRGFIDVTNVRGRLPGFATGNDGVRVDETKSIDNDFSFDRLYGINDYRHRPSVERLE